MEAVLAEVRATDWTLWDVPLAGRLWDYQPQSVPAAFQALTSVADESAARTAYTALLNALGHNHSGTPYPAMVPGARLLADLAPLVGGWQLFAVVEVLHDCFLWTRGEADFITADGRKLNLADDTAAAVTSLRPVLEQLAVNEDEPVQRAAKSLLSTLDGD